MSTTGVTVVQRGFPATRRRSDLGHFHKNGAQPVRNVGRFYSLHPFNITIYRNESIGGVFAANLLKHLQNCNVGIEKKFNCGHGPNFLEMPWSFGTLLATKRAEYLVTSKALPLMPSPDSPCRRSEGPPTGLPVGQGLAWFGDGMS